MLLRSKFEVFLGTGIPISLLSLLTLAASGDALAQTLGSIGSDPPAQATPDKDQIPRGGCMPIGVTASGEVVFPFTCKAFLEQRRGPIEEPKSTEQSSMPALTQKAGPPVAIAPQQAAASATNEGVTQPVEADSSPISSIESPRGTALDKGTRRAKRAQHSRSKASR